MFRSVRALEGPIQCQEVINASSHLVRLDELVPSPANRNANKGEEKMGLSETLTAGTERILILRIPIGTRDREKRGKSHERRNPNLHNESRKFPEEGLISVGMESSRGDRN